jgi:DNA modification methylase
VHRIDPELVFGWAPERDDNRVADAWEEYSPRQQYPQDGGTMERWSGTTDTALTWNVYCGDAKDVLSQLQDATYNCIVTSPPYYWLRDYGVRGQIGQEETVKEYVDAIVGIMSQIYRVLKPDGLLFLNLGDTYYSGKGQSQGIDPKSNKRRFGLRAVDKSGGVGIGIKPKSVIGVPWRVALGMADKGWVLRSSIIWHRKDALPEAVKDRPRRSYEYVFMFAKNRKYYFNRDALLDVQLEEDVWTISARPKPTNGLDTAPFPDELVQRCLDLGCPQAGSVLDPFAGGGTTLRVALTSGRHATGIDLNPEFCKYMVAQMTSLEQQSRLICT